MTCPTWCTRQHHTEELDPASCHSRAVLDAKVDGGAMGVALELAGALTEAVRLVGASS